MFYKPPSLTDCIALQGQRNVQGQDQLDTGQIEIFLDVSVYDECTETDAWLSRVNTFVEEALIPSLAGCNTADSQNCIRYVVTNADVTNAALGGRRWLEQSCEDGAELPCLQAAFELDLYLKGGVTFFSLSSLILEDVDLSGLLAVAFSGDSLIKSVNLFSIRLAVPDPIAPKPTARPIGDGRIW